ncbi:MAG: hypothetical protein J7L15_06000 [Clostridiales bacterium]|nr:hypothetical protein [Clostridiales bacterium]
MEFTVGIFWVVVAIGLYLFAIKLSKEKESVERYTENDEDCIDNSNCPDKLEPQ